MMLMTTTVMLIGGGGDNDAAADGDHDDNAANVADVADVAGDEERCQSNAKTKLARPEGQIGHRPVRIGGEAAMRLRSRECA